MGYRPCNPQRDGQYKPSLILVDVENEDVRVIVLAHDPVTVTDTGINICVSEVMGVRVTVAVMEFRVTVTVMGISVHAVVVVVVEGTEINVLVSLFVGMSVDTIGLIRVSIGEDQIGSVVKAPGVAGVVRVAVLVGLNLIVGECMDMIFLVRENRKITVVILATEME